ncbi:dTDP-4-dehydrorhamnose reductase [Crossiella cryophila]|uniref:dTDP-4-dehydrorhamnose reductase n=1 Tax=Crossiella cryophila TaxID=43355 RepID=A0A7W7FSC9_9PSEU|nr:dTDP-4-dehydrorhamnose reductase [Crossiella cryophila]MBB4675800.1 dTDP-4-dehydrorhamnose reductase [Crossiella cryophila]
MPGLGLLVTGGRGQLGTDLAALASTKDGWLTHAPGSAELDVSEADAVEDAVHGIACAARDAGLRPVVISAGAYTAVDAAETDEDRALAINGTGAGLLAKACAARDVPLIHLSTDYVFPGDGTRPYEPSDATGPRSAYGRTKLAGERAVLDSGALAYVVRTQWVYGSTGKNFVRTMVRLESSRDTLSVVDDQVGCPTWTVDLAAGLLDLAVLATGPNPPEQRLLHCAGGGETTWYRFTQAIFTELGADPERVKPCTSADFPSPVKRPPYSVLSPKSWESAGLTPLRPWREALTAAFAEQGERFRAA